MRIARRLSPLLCLFLVLVTPPARGATGTLFTLDSPLQLAPEADPHGHTPPGIALRDDGGLIAAWTDIDTHRVLGRWFGPADLLGLTETETALFELTGENTSDGPVAVARQPEDRFLAVWRNLAPGTELGGLSALPFDGSGTPLAGSVLVVDQPVQSFALAGRPGGGFVLAWWLADDMGSPELRFRFLGPGGEVATGAVAVATLPADEESPTVRVAVAPDGGFLISWSSRNSVTGETALHGRAYSATGTPLGPAATLVPSTPGGFRMEHDVAATGPGAYLLVWAPPAGATSPPSTVMARPFDAALAPTGPAQVVTEDDSIGASIGAVAVAADSGRAGVVGWAVKRPPSTANLNAMLVDADGQSRSGTFKVVGTPLVNGVGFGGITQVDLVRDDEGRMAFGWGAAIDPGFLPSEENLNWVSGARRYLETDPACYPILTTELRTEPEMPLEGEPVRLLFEGLADCADVTLTDWSRTAGGVRVEANAEELICGTFPPFGFSLPVDAGTFTEGSYQANLEIALPGGGTCARQLGFAIGPPETEPPPDEPPPPDAPPLTSPDLPGFQVWVQITPQSGPVILGGTSPACIPETLCVSGALPGRPEVFVRVVGPKGNGYLWPTLVKFSTSTVEVWIEQTATGVTRYYKLEGASPGNDVLPGLFDRKGFLPQ